MKVLAVLAVVLALSFALSEREYQNAFRMFMQKHEKSYHHADFVTRYNIFKNNLDYIEKHNAQGKSFTLAMNKFGDLSSAEFNKIYKGLKMATKPLVKASVQQSSTVGLPDSWDWRSNNATPVVTYVKDQGQCGSCWAFSTTGSTEGCHALSGNKLVALSEQNLVDCSGDQGNDGCDGGLMTQAMDYIISNNGIDTETSYPYKAVDGNCNFNAANVGATLKAYTNVATGDEGDLQKKVYAGPTSVAIDASNPSFQFYSGGVYNEPACSTSELDHGVLAVGYGSSSGTPYWIVKNSWGDSWGLQGYIWMSRNSQNQCGIATMATLPSC